MKQIDYTNSSREEMTNHTRELLVETLSSVGLEPTILEHGEVEIEYKDWGYYFFPHSGYVLARHAPLEMISSADPLLPEWKETINKHNRLNPTIKFHYSDPDSEGMIRPTMMWDFIFVDTMPDKRGFLTYLILLLEKARREFSFDLMQLRHSRPGGSCRN